MLLTEHLFLQDSVYYQLCASGRKVYVQWSNLSHIKVLIAIEFHLGISNCWRTVGLVTVAEDHLYYCKFIFPMLPHVRLLGGDGWLVGRSRLIGLS